MKRGPARTYLAYAAGYLALTLVSGVWLRAVFVHPEVLGGLRFGDVLHAHSHVAFFGWTTPALFALVAGILPASPGRDRWLVVHAHLIGIASGAAFLGFMLSGYAAYTIALSSLHVALWVAFALTAWQPLDTSESVHRSYLRAALAFLVIAGAGAMLPGVVMAKGITDAWIGQITLQGFLTPFVSGWLLLGVMGAVYGLSGSGRFTRPVLLLSMVGVLPSAFLHTTAPPPAEALVWVGRGGTLLLGAAALLFGADLLRQSGRSTLLRFAGAAAILKGVAEVAAAAGPALALLGVRNLSIAYLHLVLLALVTPLLLVVALGIVKGRRRQAGFAWGVGTMLVALALLGWPGQAGVRALLGLTPMVLLWIALAGAILAAASAMALIPLIRTRRAATAQDRVNPHDDIRDSRAIDRVRMLSASSPRLRHSPEGQAEPRPVRAPHHSTF